MIRIQPLDTSSAPDYVDLLNIVLGKHLTAEQLFASDARAEQAGLLRVRWLASWLGEPSGAAALLASPYNPPDELDVQIVVSPSKRGMGIGTALLSHLVQEASRRSAIAIRCSIGDDDAESVAWAERRDSSRIHRRFESELDACSFDDGAHHRRSQSLEQAGLIIRSMAEFNTEQNWIALHDLFLALLSDAPDMKDLPTWTTAQVKSVLEGNPHSKPNWQLLVCDRTNQWHGMSVLTRLGLRACIFFTGVSRSMRGRGLAGVLQGEAVLRAKHEGFKTVFLNNLSTNEPMIAVNRRLGFDQRPGFWILRKPV